MRRTILGVVVACAVLAIPASANAAQVRAFGTNISVSDHAGQFADDITFTKLGTIRIVNNGGNPAEPLLLIAEQPSPVPVPDSGQLSCSQDNPRQVTCIRLTGGPPTLIGISTGSGNDTVTVGPHSADESVTVEADSGSDTVNIENGSADNVACGDDVDTARVDAYPLDTLLPPFDSCETLINNGVVQGLGGQNPTPPATPVAKLVLGPVLSPHRGKLLVAARVNGPGLVTGKATKGKKQVAKGSTTATKAGAVTLVLKPTKAGKRLLKSKPSVKVKLKLAFKPTKGATVVKTISARLRR
jgi:hypothetical protein